MYSEGNYRLRGSGLRAAHMVKINVPSDGRDTPVGGTSLAI